MTAPHYPSVDPNPDFPKMEEDILHFWQEQEVFRRSVEERPAHLNGKNNEFIFYDGPPFANGLPHYGHLLTGFVKDAVARYQTMLGKRVERRFGWDCHGLPAEMGAEKELGISGRQQITNYGIGKFNDYCRSSVMKYRAEWEYYVTRQARWVDFTGDYKTMDKGFMESVLWAFKQLWDKGYVYEAYRVMPYSWAAETPLSNFETRLDNAYREREDKAITVSFKLNNVEFEKRFSSSITQATEYSILAWTTTPWTLPSNLALAVNSDIPYLVLKNLITKKTYVFAASALTQFGTQLGVSAIGLNAATSLISKQLQGNESIYSQFLVDADELGSGYHGQIIMGSELIGLTYVPLFPYFADHPNAFRILDGSDFVTDTDGTGIVHLAPGFGEDDQRVCEANGIELVCPVDHAGRFTDEIYDLPAQIAPPLAGGSGGMPSSGKFGAKQDTTRNKDIMPHAKSMRADMTQAEYALWEMLSGKKLEGFKFRRQQTIGSYIADFVCMEKKLVLEIDGSQHQDTQAGYDTDRTTFLEQAGYRVLRFWNNEVLENLEGVVERILGALREEASPLNPPASGGTFGELKLKGLNVIAENAKEYKFGEANERIIQWLKAHGQLIKQETISHNYPHCWRTDTPLIYRALPSWYVEVTKFKDRMVELNRQINWIPEHVKDGLFGKWLENARDWSISRNRFWGTPIPVWRSDDPRYPRVDVYGSISELEHDFNVEVKDLHRPYIDELTRPNPDDPTGKSTMRRVPDVFDCWFESGSMPYGQAHYPFENKDWFESHFPADFIVEYMAQTRGWFYTLMVLSTALFDKPPFLNVICHGVVLDDKGQKLSKRLNNYADPTELFNKFGADALRWFMLSSPVMRGAELQIDPEGKFIRDVVRLHIKPVWNAYNFFCLYANSDKVQAEFSTASTQLMDQYILAKLAHNLREIKRAMDAYQTPDACEAAGAFFETLNNWYIRRSKPRFWKEIHDQDKQDAYNTLYTCLHAMLRAIAPLMPLAAEEMYLGLTNRGAREGGKSVHLAEFPQLDSAALENPALEQAMDKVQDICNTALSLRSARNIRVRLPLESLTVVGEACGMDAELAAIVRDEVNVKNIFQSSDLNEYADLKLQVLFPVVGKRLPEKMKQIIPAAKKGEWQALPGGRLFIAGAELEPGEFTLQLEPKPAFKDSAQAVKSNDALVILDMEITPELEREGLARDLVRLIQQARKDAGLDVADRIALSVQGGRAVKLALEAHRDYIAQQTLAGMLQSEPLPEAAFTREAQLEGEGLVVSLAKMA